MTKKPFRVIGSILADCRSRLSENEAGRLKTKRVTEKRSRSPEKEAGRLMETDEVDERTPEAMEADEDEGVAGVANGSRRGETGADHRWSGCVAGGGCGVRM